MSIEFPCFSGFPRFVAKCVISVFCLFQMDFAKPDGVKDCCIRDPALAARARHSHELITEIDKIFPRRNPEVGTPARILREIKAPNVMTFTSGESIEIDGVACDKSGIDNLERVLGSSGVEILIEYAEPLGGSRPLAHVWVREELRIGTESVMGYSSPAETALTSGWCVPISMEDKELGLRYSLLHAVFKDRRESANSELEVVPW